MTPPTSLQLVVRDQGRAIAFPLTDGEHLVGAGADSAVRLAHPAVSRRHAVVRVSGGGVEIEDLGSRNGTLIGGRRIAAACRVEVGETIAFGAVEAQLEAVAAHDLETAIAFETPAERARSGGHDTPAQSTAAVGSLRVFALDLLPSLLREVDEGHDAGKVARSVGAALFRTLPCEQVEVASHAADGDAIVFQARRDRLSEHPAEAAASGRAFRVRVLFPHETQARGYAPLVQAASRLVSLADRRRRPAPAERPDTPDAPLPQPPSVDPQVQRLYRDAAHVARGDVSVLITGESGTGKELLARYLHAASPRRSEPFVALNCAALPRDLLEAELFGVEEGVATGVRARPGKFEIADRGTLFLDEVGDMAPETQARILRVLQEGTVYRLGGRDPRSARVRVVAATNCDMPALLADGRFRTDLYHRIADWTVQLPALRERRADVANLTAHFLQREAEKRGVRVAGVSQAALDVLVAYSWPGNIRQLEREMARAVLFLEDGQLLQTHHLQPSIREAPRAAPRTLKERLDEAERREIAAALSRHDGNLSAVARELDIGRSTLYRRMKELGISE